MQIRIGVIGLGDRMRQVLEHLLPIDSQLRLAAVCDPSPTALVRASKLSPDVKPFADYRAMVRDPGIDWVFVGSWNCFHAEHAIAGLEAGKHVFCEKPLATTLSDCLAIRDAVDRSDRTFCFGLVLRFSPHYQRVHDLVKSGQIGALVSFEFNESIYFYHGGYIFGNWRRRTQNAGTHVLEKCCHDLDLANWIADSLPVRAASFGGRSVFTAGNGHLGDRAGLDSQGRSVYRQWHSADGIDPFSGDSDLLDHQVVILEYANGVHASFHANANAALPERRFYLLGTEGTVQAEAYSGRITLRRIGYQREVEDHSAEISGSHVGGDAVLASHLADTMLRSRPPLAGINEAIRSAVVAFAIDQAQTSGQVVDLRPLWREAGIGCSAEPVRQPRHNAVASHPAVTIKQRQPLPA